MVLNGYDDWQVRVDEGTAINGFNHVLREIQQLIRVCLLRYLIRYLSRVSGKVLTAPESI